MIIFCFCLFDECWISLGSELLDAQTKQFEDVILGFKEIVMSIFTILWHFIDWSIHLINIIY